MTNYYHTHEFTSCNGCGHICCDCEREMVSEGNNTYIVCKECGHKTLYSTSVASSDTIYTPAQ